MESQTDDERVSACDALGELARCTASRRPWAIRPGSHTAIRGNASTASARRLVVGADALLDWFANLWRNFAVTSVANLCGIPAISLPLATHEPGLSLGFQAIGKQANDGLLLQLAAQIERASGDKWNGGSKPGVHVTS